MPIPDILDGEEERVITAQVVARKISVAVPMSKIAALVATTAISAVLLNSIATVSVERTVITVDVSPGTGSEGSDVDHPPGTLDWSIPGNFLIGDF